MEKGTCYSSNEWDEVADIPTLHLSYIIHLLLPRRYFEKERVERNKQMLIEGFSKFEGKVSPSLRLVPVGSKFEGYSIPDAVRLGDNPYIECLSDVDATLIREEFSASVVEYSKDGNRNSIFIETNQTRPGYARIRFSCPKDTESKMLYHDKENNKFYLKSSEMIQGQTEILKNTEGDNMDVFPHGPAMSVTDPEKMTHERSKTKSLMYPQDYTVAIPCHGWPDNATSWATRKRTNGWLAQDIIEHIMGDGFQIVPVAHKLSNFPDIEWRVSFAKAEQYLAEHCVTAAQRQCYIYLKILRKQVLPENVDLSSYCLKNVFLYSCDELPKAAWEDDPAGCCLYMLDVLQGCVTSGNLPGYFVPENNLICHLKEEELGKIREVVENIRTDPIAPVLEFTDCRVLCYGPHDCLSYSTTFRYLIQLVLDEIASIEQLDSGRSILGCFTDVQCNLASVMLGEKRTSFWHHLDFYQFFVKRYVQMSFVDFLNYMGIRLETPFLALMFYEKCISQVDVYPELEYLRGNMACMCFALAQTNDENSKERKMRMHQAERLYNEVLQKSGIHFATTIDFGNFLSYNERWREAIGLLESFAEIEERKQTGMQNGYYPAEATTLNIQIQREVKHNGCFLARSLSFAYYFLVQAYFQSKSDRVDVILRKFQKHCESNGSYGDYELLGYCGLIAEKPDLAQVAFSKSVTLTSNNLLAQVNLNLCEVKEDSRIDNRVLIKTALKFGLGLVNILQGNISKTVDLLFSN